MDFKTYFNQAWSDHALKADEVADSFSLAQELLTESTQVPGLAHLITHVMGEHLRRYDEGVALVTRLKLHPLADSGAQLALSRSEAILKFSADQRYDLSGFSVPEQARIVATAAGALSSPPLFKKALELAKDIEKADPANRALAVSANSIASTLEEKENLTEDEKKLMLDAAFAARKYWEIAGGWLEVERAEYRLAQSYLKAKDYISSIKHANLCLTICEANSAGPLEFFFAYEAIALIEKATGQPLRSLPRMQKYFAELAEADKPWYEASFKKLL